MKNKTDIQTKNQQIDKILQEQYDVETKILESALLNAAGKTSWDEFPEESEEKIRIKIRRHIRRHPFLKKNKKILFFCVIFADLIRIVYVMKVCEAEIRHFILRISVRIKGSEQNVIYLCTDRQRIIKISANF